MSSIDEGGGFGRRRWPLVLWLALSLWLVVSLPLAFGGRTLCLRDVFATHLHLKAFGAAELVEGRIPAFNPGWGLGQSFRGNPNALAFYPGNLLYLMLPFWSAFNLHYVLHWLLAAVSFFLFARQQGLSPPAARLAALTWAGSGWLLSAMTFYNLLTVAAWWPLVLWGAGRGGRRGIAVGGVACGLALLGGEPLTAVLGLVPLLLVAVGRLGWRRGVLATAAIGGLGLLVALPQLVATLRVFDFSFRSAHGLMPTRPGTYVMHPARLLELLVPYPFGFPGDLGVLRFWAREVSPRIPWVLTLHLGVIGFWLALWGLRRRPRWAVLAGLGLLLAWAGGQGAGLLDQLSAGLFRYPEKFLFWFAIAAPLLVGAGFEAILERGRSPRRSALAAAGLYAAAALLLWLRLPTISAWLAPRVAEASLPGTVQAQLALWLASLLWAAALLLAAGLLHRRPSALAALQLAALLPLLPLLVSDESAAYRSPPEWAGLLPAGAGVVSGTFDSPFRDPPAPYRPEDRSIPGHLRLAAADLDPSPGVLHGLSYPLAPDLEGMHTPLAELLLLNLPRLGWPERVRWLRTVGAEAVVLAGDPQVEGLEEAHGRWQAGVEVGLYRVTDPAPRAWWPETVRVAESPVEALRQVSGTPDPVAEVTLAEPVQHRPGAQLRVVTWEPDRIEVVVEGEGGVLVIRRAYHPLWRVYDERGPLRQIPVNLHLLGVEVPPGRSTVRLEVSSRPEVAALMVGWLCALLAGWVAWRD